jgi:hypothetical protein
MRKEKKPVSEDSHAAIELKMAKQRERKKPNSEITREQAT